jgi:hypothetical protein
VVEAFAELADETVLGVSINRTPVTAEIEAYHQKDVLIVIGCGFEHEFKVGRRPLRIWLNIQTPYVPITSDGKAPDLSGHAGIIEIALEKVVKSAKRGAGRSAKEKTQKGVVLKHLDEAVVKASGGGQYRFSIRQLFYVIRPFVIEELGEELGYEHFCDPVITDYEANNGPIVGMYRDPRGTIYHPHLDEEIPLGTRQVEAYLRPRYAFNKVLFCEKEGILSILREANWPERNDCALMSSKGFSSRAARDLIDDLESENEDIYVYCIHDSDASGTMIYHTLLKPTRARPGRKVHVVNLGLDPWEALSMGLQVEKVERKKRKLRVADYIKEDGVNFPIGDFDQAKGYESWTEWLHANRVELNAMTTPQLIEWLDSKFDAEIGKVIPPRNVMLERLERDVQSQLERQITDRVLREARVEEQVRTELTTRMPVIASTQDTIEQQVKDDLDTNPTRHWRAGA